MGVWELVFYIQLFDFPINGMLPCDTYFLDVRITVITRKAPLRTDS